ncbi:unnamed protein product [Closterium sp. Yama58-4]|nr:unnamed protein product [Closterium sp. Yama58-4]
MNGCSMWRGARRPLSNVHRCLPDVSFSDDYSQLAVADDIEQDEDDVDAAIGNAGAGSGATTVTNAPPVRPKLGVVRNVCIRETGKKGAQGATGQKGFSQQSVRQPAGNDDTASGRVGDVNRLSGRGAYVDGAPETPRSLRDYGWDAAEDDGIGDAVRALQSQVGDMKRALLDSNEAIKALNALVQKSLDLQQEVHSTLASLQASGLPTAPAVPNNGGGSGACGGSGSGSNDTEDATHASELKRAVATIMEPARLSSRYVAVFLKCITEGDGTGDKGLSMWPDLKLVVKWSAATGAIRENQKERLLYCLNHSSDHSNTWSAVAARMRGGITRVGKTVLFRFFGIPRHVADMPREVPWRVVTCTVYRIPRTAFEAYPIAGYSMPWHCNEDGLPFSTDAFEIFIAAAYWRLLQRKVLRIYPYTLAFALYGAEYPVVHHDRNRAGLPTKDTPNIHNTDRMRAIVVNWMRDAIFSAGTHFRVLIAFPPPVEVRALPTEIVGPEMSDADDEIPTAPAGPAQA